MTEVRYTINMTQTEYINPAVALYLNRADSVYYRGNITWEEWQARYEWAARFWN